MKTYTAITIGPIINTLNAARKTRELWGASYLFSYIIRRIVQKLKADNVQVLLPFYKDELEWINPHGAGLFPDRIFVEGEIDIETKYYTDVLNELSDDICEWINSRKKLKKTDPLTMYNYLNDYFRFIQIVFNCDASENIIEIGSTILDSKELQAKIIAEDDYIELENPLFSFLYNVNSSFLFQAGFGKTGKQRFPSLIEIAAKEFKVIEPSKFREVESEVESIHENFGNLQEEKKAKKSEDDILEKIEVLFPKQLSQVHKYVAIVQADGDKIGQIVSQVGKSTVSIQNFSQKLMNFSKVATDMVVKYGGSPVYMGGDDLFFFAPVIYRIGNKKTHILEMIDELNKIFNDVIITYAKDVLAIPDKDLPSLSFGISLSYYKFPLYEAKNMAFNALFNDIKWADRRNAIKIKFRKHSGQLMEVFINKNNPQLWDSTISFISKNLEIDARFLNSFTHKLRLQDDVLFDKLANSPEKLENFFKNNFNENYKSNIDYYSALQLFIQEINQHADSKERKNYLYTVLRFIHFLRS